MCRCGEKFRRPDILKRHQKGCTLQDPTAVDAVSTTIVVKRDGEEIPWKGNQKLILLAPVAVCWLIVPKKWSSSLACNRLGLNDEQVEQFLASQQPMLEEAHAKAEGVMSEAAAEVEEGACGKLADFGDLDTGCSEEDIDVDIFN
jgi:hypothetical protein